MAAPAAALDTFPVPDGWNIISSEREASEVIGPGVTHDRFKLATQLGPIEVSILTVDLSNPFVSLGAVAANGDVQGPGERLSSLADSVHAEAGINADYYDINGSGAPNNALITSGLMLHQPDGAATFSVDDQGKAAIGPLTWSASVSQVDSGASLRVASVNDWSASTPLTLLTPQLGSTAAYDAAEVVLTPLSGGSYSVRAAASDLATLVALQPGEIALAAHGESSAEILHDFAPGATAAITFDGSPPPGSLHMAVGGGPQLLRDGQPYNDPVAPAPQEADVRYPLTGAGITADGRTLYLVVVDGRRPGASVGVTRAMLGQLFAALGAADAMAFDSGGSSELVVRALGDPAVHVATTPSDGRERSIADALIVMNAATPGPADHLLVSAAMPALLVGSRDRITVKAVDVDLQPVMLESPCAGISISPVASVDSDCDLTGLASGVVSVSASAGGASGAATISIVSKLATLTIEGFEPDIPVNGSGQLSVVATDDAGEPTAVDPSAVTWSVSGDARIDNSGSLVAGSVPSVVRVSAVAGGMSAYADVDIGDHTTVLAPMLPLGDAPQAWTFAPSSALVSGSLNDSVAPDATRATALTYDLSAGPGVRAAYTRGAIAIAGTPLAITCDVYGDGNGEWLRAEYAEPGGINDTLTLARHVDWIGWRTLRGVLPAQAQTSITLTRIYVAQPSSQSMQGAIWLRNIGAVYPGP